MRNQPPRFRVVGSVQIIEDGADHAGVPRGPVRLDDSVETILRFQRFVPLQEITLQKVIEGAGLAVFEVSGMAQRIF